MGDKGAAEQSLGMGLLASQPQVEKGELQALQIPGVGSVAVLKGGKEFVGAHGSVKEGVWHDNEGIAHSVAIKTVKVAGSEKCLKTINKEIEILAKLPSHPNVVRVVGVRPGEEPVIVEEWMPMTLKDLLNETGPVLNSGDVVRITLDVAKGVCHLHKHRVTHHDIKPANILLDETCNAKLADFTCSVFQVSSLIDATRHGTLGYMAPECMQCGVSRSRPRVRAEKIDVYSLGKVMLSCVVGNLDNGKTITATSLCPTRLWSLICDCTKMDPEGRPSCQQVVERLESMVKDGLEGEVG
ncbi:unnamed protein product [Ostreobium quekettii]|uniref:Protein kinase domain-containing protein n=1 Tax=Ostreobium quekettii TaxID=121088 RepID=A0A8S1J5D9_9CHLO|nr:unnamed protein product [Ostreobium quekettii]